MTINVSEDQARELVELYDERDRLKKSLTALHNGKAPAYFRVALSGFGVVDKCDIPLSVVSQNFKDQLAQVDRFLRQAGGIVPAD